MLTTKLRKTVLSMYIARNIQIALQAPPRRYWYWAQEQQAWSTDDGVSLACSGLGGEVVEMTALEYARLVMRSRGTPLTVQAPTPEQWTFIKGQPLSYGIKLDPNNPEIAARLPGWTEETTVVKAP